MVIGFTHFLPMYGLFERPDGMTLWEPIAWFDEDYNKAYETLKETLETEGMGFTEYAIIRDHDSEIMARAVGWNHMHIFELVEHVPYIAIETNDRKE